MRAADERAFGHCRAGDLARARSGFEACLGIDPHDRAARLLLAQVATTKAQGLPHGRDGVGTMTNI